MRRTRGETNVKGERREQANNCYFRSSEPVTFSAFQAVLAAFVVILFAGCGYQFRVEGAGPTIGSATATSSSTTPPPRLVVRTLENKSFEPNLEVRYTNYLRHEFSSGSGAQVVPEAEAADLVLSGQILSVSVPTLSFTQTTTLESRTEVVVTVKVEETRTKRLVWSQTAKGASEFFVTTDLNSTAPCRTGLWNKPADSSLKIWLPAFCSSWNRVSWQSRAARPAASNADGKIESDIHMASAISHAQLKALLTQGMVAPFYVVVGEEDLLRDIA